MKETQRKISRHQDTTFLKVARIAAEGTEECYFRPPVFIHILLTDTSSVNFPSSFLLPKCFPSKALLPSLCLSQNLSLCPLTEICLAT